mmetsp:Transcript_41066/g.89724  ORF Transcript_41066/g.89724 Transcript_41066/m.89724 type:complete len:185 (+) Transcript_41066:81-635(+)|eukprot:CAMPEP_0170597920 /NCGR_PEP_ID=MMETSP0224-20130122/15967_1 /TAXON_ID=285029 /ORGANISM="Togula jolla, Strain CCCM 725" /LENGTH=184 /DNA_ID=CAMNT_0010922429 /DNA_START=80 /DNA_END=634 /DNA_ORIENTATION=+
MEPARKSSAHKMGAGRPRNGLVAVTAAAAAAFVALALLPGNGSSFAAPGIGAVADGIALRPAAAVKSRVETMTALQADPNTYGNLYSLESKKAPRKPPYIAPFLLKAVTRMNKEGIKETIQIWNRQSVIVPAMIGHTIAVHNGKDYIPLQIIESMVGFRLSGFVPTHTFKGHPKASRVTKFKGR